MPIRSRIRRIFRPTKRYEELEAEGVTDPDRIARGAVRWADDYDALPRDWPYLRRLIDDDVLGADFGLRYPRFVPLERMLAYDDGAVFEEHLRWLLPEYWDGYPPERQGITPEMVFRAMDLLVDVPCAQYTTSGGVCVVLQNHGLYRPGQLYFRHSTGTSIIDLWRARSFDIRDNRVIVNGAPGTFEFPLQTEDREALTPLMEVMMRTITANRTERTDAKTATVDPWTSIRPA